MSIVFLHGDCLEKMKDLSGASVDCFICDLPYGCLTKPCSWDIPLDLDKFWEQVRRLRKNDNTPCLMFCSTKFGHTLIKSNEQEFRYDLVWTKTNAVGFITANTRPMSCHEMIYVFSKKRAYYQRINIKGDFPAGGGGRSSANFLPIAGMPNTGTTIAGERCPTTIMKFANKKRKGGHPTEKPMELYKFLLERFCPPGGTILDPTAGSFNSCFAAMQLDRNAIGIEKDLDFFNKACKRADDL